MVTTEILQSLGYSSLGEYFERIYTLDMEADGETSPDAELMFDALSEEQQAEYEMFVTDYYYEYHDNKNNKQVMNAKKYPFEEGDIYFTIEGDCVVQSVWDAQSEELYSISKMYFGTIKEAVFCYQMKQMQDMLTKCIECISNFDCDEESYRKLYMLLNDYHSLDINPKTFSFLS